MRKFLITVLFITSSILAYSQDHNSLFTDSLLKHASVSVYIADVNTGEPIIDYNSEESVVPASVLKLYTSAAALELLGPDYSFSTVLAYSGHLNSRTGVLDGDIIIKGGGDPTLASKRFPDFYSDFPEKWVKEIKELGIRKIRGRVITDDSYYDYEPVPAKWLWEDAGNYYGAGAYGLSIYDNTYEIHLDTYSDSTKVRISYVTPPECKIDLNSRIALTRNTDLGYVFSAPYSINGWLAGSLPVNRNDLVLRASINDPPLLMAKLMNNKLKEAGIKIAGEPSTTRLMSISDNTQLTFVSVVKSPTLSEIIKALNHQSINLYAEHLLKELGKVYSNEGTTSRGLEVLYKFLNEAGLSSEGIFLVDGSGLSPANVITSKGLVSLLVHLRKNGKYFPIFLNSLALPGEGTLKSYFRDPVFISRIYAKSGSMTRVRSFSGYLSTLSGRELSFSIIVNNFTGPSSNITVMTESLLKNLILSK